MSRFKVIDHKSGIEQIVNPIAAYARRLREYALALDTETTGVSKEDEVIELGVVRALSGEVLIDRQFRPTKKVNSVAFKIHGITDAQLACQSPISDAWLDLYPVLDGSTCIAWNAKFDSRLLAQTIGKYNLDEPRIEWICVMGLYRQFRQLPKDPKLEDVCRALGVKTGNHRALNDALAAARVLYRMAEAVPEDEVITYEQGREEEEADETAMTARDFLTQLGWRERKIAPVGGVEVASQWIDPDSGRFLNLNAAIDVQRERMREAL